MLYLISESRMEFANVRAREKALGPREWIYIPWEPIKERKAKMCGLRVDEAHLIGYFTDEERFLLTR